MIVARDPERLQQGIQYIRSGAVLPSTQRFHHISSDLTRPEECAKVIANVTEWNLGLPPDIVWCCAGSSHPTLFVDTDISQFQTQMDSNYFSSVYTAHAILRAWLKPDRDEPTRATSSVGQATRHLIFTSSFVAFYPIAGYAPYSPSKAALRTLSDSLSQEVNLYAAAHPHSSPVRVHTVFPATILTESNDADNLIKSDLTKMFEATDKGQTAEEVAKISIKGLESGHELITCNIMTRFVMCATLGTSRRGGFWKGLADWFMGCAALAVMAFIRADMDRKVRNWGKSHGDSGMKRQQ